ncbi:WD40/YVTN/BNR-like repeat-containing protein [Maribacter polysaccharolyticus]|uniref:WD40/YVTN/BNR-like repeat-containing protein n=1 Tax=Maribacter polysaccharolyticus TaxID=3020831 RepID=UPI00237F7A68|nr:glycosyl hydrolase [Maribacter polysaccharolyticus]MDE3742324.1 glycosyl hydrolase [Maribacter polysaccharolyticus]
MKKPLLLILLLATTLGMAQNSEDYFKPLKYRNIGPFRGGRSVTATGVVGDPLTYYMGTTGGGLWKTTDAGQRWENISDGFFEMGSVGAVTVSASNPNIVYCGMGEHAPRGVMTSYGDGVYKSTDAGKTWKKVGLEATQHIARIIIHPTNPDIVYVAAQGALYGPNKDRGIYKSIDGGKTWKNTLFVNELTGCSELSMDANYPEIMYATMWHHQRKPNMVISGGEGSGVYKSTDAGDTWFKIEKGLPEEKGKMAISVSPANSDKVYALVESDSDQDKGGLFVSNDAGESWSRISGDNRLTQRAWYYTEVFTDPNDENTVYVLSAPALRSIDGGRSWKTLSGTHGDYHDLWINPDNSKNMVIANDGGAAISFNFGKTWSTQDIMPTAQFYRISVDNLFPYNIYAGQQDNTSVKIASRSFGRSGITEQDWTYTAGGESAFLAFDPNDPRYVLGGSYLGTIEALDMESKVSTQIMAAPIQYLGREARDMKYLYNWNAPILRSQHEPNTFYHCAQLVLRTRDMGLTWEEMSPDLTRNIDELQGNGGGPFTNEAVGAENYGTIAYMMESPHESGVFWTGSDDGFVHVTRDNGTTWQNVTPKGLKQCLVNAIEVSPHDPATAYIATTRYKFNDYTPAIYKTTDYGKNWTNISTGIPYGSFTRVVREDADRKGLLYAGTEKGVYISWNDGRSWEPFQLNLPKTPITDLKVHHGNLIVATSGRAFWILDDLNVLQQYKASDKGLRIVQPADALNGSWRSPMSGNTTKFTGTDPYNGVNPANGMVIYYELPKLADSTHITLDILDSDNRLVLSFTSKKDKNAVLFKGGGPSPEPILDKKEGLNRFVWNMQYPLLPGIPDVYIEAGFRGHKASPGTYTLKLKMGDKEVSTVGNIVEMPTYETKEGQYKAYDAFMTEMEGKLTVMHTKLNSLYKIQQQLKSVLKGLNDEALKAEGQKLLDELDAWDKKMVQRKSKAYDDVENFPNKFTAEYLFLIDATNSGIPRVNQSSRDRKAELDAQWAVLDKEAERLGKIAIPAFNKKLWEQGIGALQWID